MNIPQTSLDDVKHGEREMSQFDEDFKAMFGHYPGRSGSDDRDETLAEQHARIASYDLGHPTIH